MKGKELDKEITLLEGMLFSTMNRDHWKRFWDQCKKVGAAFKIVRYPTKDEKDEAWQRFIAIREPASERADRERQDRRWKSEHHRHDIIGKAEEARPAPMLMNLIDPTYDEVETMKALGPSLLEAGKMLSDRKHGMLGEHKSECFKRIQEIREIHDLFWAEYKKTRARQRAEWEERTRARVSQNYERLEKARAARDRKRSHADRLRSEIASAWNADWAYRREVWLAEEEAKIRDIEEHIDRIKGWIAEDEEKLYR